MGLDPQTTAKEQAEAAAAKKAAEIPALNPEFPYGKKRFDPFYFGVERPARKED